MNGVQPRFVDTQPAKARIPNETLIESLKTWRFEGQGKPHSLELQVLLAAEQRELVQPCPNADAAACQGPRGHVCANLDSATRAAVGWRQLDR
jgi:hypothetical protein